MTIEDYFRAIAHSAVSAESSDEEVLSLMVIMHTYRFELAQSTNVSDVGEQGVLFPLTRPHCTELIASIFPTEDKRHNPDYWYWQYDEITPFEVASRIPGEWRNKVNALLSRLLKSGLVTELIEDD